MAGWTCVFYEIPVAHLLRLEGLYVKVYLYGVYQKKKCLSNISRMCGVYGHEGDEEGEYVTYGDEVKRDADSDGKQCYR